MTRTSIKSPKEIESMRVACAKAAETLLAVGEIIAAGLTTDDINTFVHEDTLTRGGWPAPLNYRGFPKSVCTSVNDIVCHGIPCGQVLKGDFVGHGIGRKFHEDPQVKHYGKRGAGERLRAGMIFTIEPMVNEGTYAVEVDPADKWTVRTADRGLSAQFEHTVLVTKKGCDVLTARSSVLRNSENRTSLFV